VGFDFYPYTENGGNGDMEIISYKMCKDSARLIAGKKGTLDFLKSPSLLKRVKAKSNRHKLDP
jgi:hypothetical protein